MRQLNQTARLNNTSLLYVLLFILGVYLVYSEYKHKGDQDVQIDSAIKYATDKGIDPLAIRCAYSSDSKIDSLCVLYVAHTNAKDGGNISVPLKK